MEQESKAGGGSSFSGSGVMAIVLLAAGAFFVNQPLLNDLRPAAGEPRLEEPSGSQDIEARLWQDPLGAVERVREAQKAGSAPATLDPHDSSPLTDAIADHSCGAVPQVLAVTLDGSPYSEPVETRRRTRYAVLSALNASGYAPEDNEHLGYFLMPRLDANPSIEAPLLTIGPVPRYAVPFEWLRTPPNPARPLACRRVLVLWLDSHLLGDRPLGALTELAQRMASPSLAELAPRTGPGPWPRWMVIGPNGSDALRHLLTEVTPPAKAASAAALNRSNYAGRLHIYSDTATVPDQVLLESLPHAGKPADPQSIFRIDRVELTRSIGDDARIAGALVAELQRRGLHAKTTASDAQDPCRDKPRPADAPDSVAIVADWDTLYGRTQRTGFEATHDRAGFCIVPFSYVRGLDGQLPDHASSDSAKSSADDKPKPDDRRSAKNDGSQIERAEGQGQLDYLRRLAGQMRTRDHELRGRDDHPGIRAIGVLGNDLHDKLLVLQMLKREFPDVLFFTTDLDARYLHPTQQAWARNLIVASSFGLQLADPLQRDTPPFRDTYETSAFFAARLALMQADAADGGVGAADAARFDPKCTAAWFGSPRVFEIGRTAAFDFSDDTREPGNAPDAGCATIHPPGSAFFGVAPAPVRLAIAGVLLLALAGVAFLFSPTFRDALGWPVGPEKPDTLPSAAAPDPAARGVKFAILAGAALVVIATLAVAAQWAPIAALLTHHGKPMSLTEGLSSWPTEAIRAATLLLCVYLIGRGWVSLSRGLDDIARQFCLVSRRQLWEEQSAFERHMSRRARLWNIFAPWLVDEGQAPTEGVDGLSRATIGFWKRYIVQSRLRSRLTRASACVAVLLVVLGLLQAATGDPAPAPVRGPVSTAIGHAMPLLLGLAFFALLSFVADATWFCVRFVRHLNGRLHAWPQTTVDVFQARFDMPQALLHHWINLSFIRHRTACVCPLIYHPFIVLSLLLLARNPYFDNWNLSLGNKVAVGVCALVALGCALALRRTAEEARSRALKDIDEFVIRARGPNAGPERASEIEQAGLLRRRIAEIREGAFAPYTQQPLLRAALLPFAAVGGTSLLDALSLANL